MARDIIIKHEEIKDPNKITQVNETKFKEAGLDMHLHEVDALEDDHKKGIRRLKVRGPKKYFFMGG